MAIRIGIVYLGRRGAGGILALEAARHISRLTDTFSVISRQSEQIAQWQQSGLDFLAVDTFNNLYQALVSLMDNRRVRELAEQIRARQPDALLFPMLHPWNPMVKAHLPGIPSVVMVHDAIPHPGLLDRIYALLENRSIRQARRVIVLSQSMVPAVVQRGAKKGSIFVVPHPVFDYYHSFDAKPPPGKDPTGKLLFFGRITEYKGLHVLLNALAGLDAAQRPPLYVVGEGSLAPYKKQIAALSDVHLVNRWVKDEEIPAFFTPGTIVVLPYVSATQSGVIQIAAAYGLPVIASRVGGIPEQIRHEETGLLVDPGDEEQLRQAINRLGESPTFAHHLGERLKAEAQANRSWDQAAERIYHLMQECKA